QMLTEAQVNANAESYLRQFFKIVDRDKTEIVYQSTWFGGFGLADVVELTSHFTVAQMLAREDFAKRYAEQRPIALTEFLYPLLQGYDSVAIRSDVEFGGMDQKFNCLVGRDLQEIRGQRPQQVFLMPLLLGTDGRKMSQSYGNFIAFEEPPNDMYGKLMRIPDAVMMDYLELLTDVPDDELREFHADMDAGRVNPMTIKHRLAREVVTQFHDAEAANRATDHFRRVVQEGQAPEEIREFDLQEAVRAGIARQAVTRSSGDGGAGHRPYDIDLRDLLVLAGMAPSKAEAIRLIRQRAVEIGGVAFNTGSGSFRATLFSGIVMRVGKRRWVKLVDRGD
ncbi:MAG: tyrosine--tRNA ligase, partial [Chloroflexota bacterium]